MKQEVYISLIEKDLLGELSFQEKEELNSWIEQSEENKNLASDIYNAWEVSNSYGEHLQVDLDADYARLQQRIKTSSQNGIIPLNLRSIILIAASFVILLSAGYFIFNSPDFVTVEAVVDNQQLVLDDGSIIYMSKGTSIRYPRSFENDRTIQFEGSALFEVSHNPNEPFRVIGSKITTDVLGTTFSMFDDKYGSEASVQLIEGRVLVTNRSNNQELILDPGNSAQLDENGLVESEEIKLSSLPWHFSIPQFDGTELEEVVQELEQYFGVRVDLEAKMKNCLFSGEFKKEGLDEILSNMALVFNAEIKTMQDGSYAIYGGTCD